MFEVDKVKKLENKSTKILSIFTSTVQDLYGVNTEVEDEIYNREEAIKQLNEEKIALNATKDINTKMINKINQFLEE